MNNNFINFQKKIDYKALFWYFNNTDKKSKSKQLTKNDVCRFLNRCNRIPPIYMTLIKLGCRPAKRKLHYIHSKIETIKDNCIFIINNNNLEIYYDSELKTILIFKLENYAK
jgi:hypothetical protein